MKYNKIELDEKKTYEVAVIANTSSGKSTLINAIVGRKILVSKNKPCTARNIRIFDNDNVNEVIAHVLYKNGDYIKIENYSMELVDKYNTDTSNEIKEMILECNFDGIENLQKSVVVIDTPGPNNSLNEKHAKETENYLKNMNNGLIMYVIDASQQCTYDDEVLLKSINAMQKNSNDLKILFVLNKIDKIDMEKENPMETVQNCFEYLKQLGFNNINLVSTSAKAALSFKQALSGLELTRDEKRSFEDLYQNFSSYGHNFNELSVISNKIHTERTVKVNGNTYTEAGLKAALDNTGITQLVKFIEANLIETLRYTPIKLKKIKK